MVSFDADPTDPPSINTNRPVDTIMDWIGYIIVLAVAFVALTVAQTSISPVISSWVNKIPGLNGGNGGNSVEVF